MTKLSDQSQLVEAMSDNRKAIFWALLSTGAFAVVAAMAKSATNEYHVLQILFFRQVVVFFSSLPRVIKGFPSSLGTDRIGLHCIRLTGAFIALSCGIWAVSVLPLSTAISLSFAQVLFVALLAHLFLKEDIRIFQIVAVMIGFTGVLTVMRPTLASAIDLHALVPIVGALGAAAAVISVRRLSQTETTQALLFYQSAFVGLLAAMPMFWLWKTPDLRGLAFLMGMGVLAAIGQWIGIKALRLGEASVIGTIQYTQILYAVVLGFVVFGETPDVYTVIGASIIVASALMIGKEQAKTSG